jgi:hypothetical protein
MEISDRVKLLVLADRIAEYSRSIAKHDHVDPRDKYGLYLVAQLNEASDRLEALASKLT